MAETLLSSWFAPAAPPVGMPDSAIIPEDDPYDNDPLSIARNPAYTVEPIHSKVDGYLPSWKWVSPPGVGDAPQHVYSTFTLIPLSVDGPGDRPVTFFRSILPPIWANFAMRWQGMAVDGGSMLLTGLYTPEPMSSMSSDIYNGAQNYG